MKKNYKIKWFTETEYRKILEEKGGKTIFENTIFCGKYLNLVQSLKEGLRVPETPVKEYLIIY